MGVGPAGTAACCAPGEPPPNSWLRHLAGQAWASPSNHIHGVHACARERSMAVLPLTHLREGLPLDGLAHGHDEVVPLECAPHVDRRVWVRVAVWLVWQRCWGRGTGGDPLQRQEGPEQEQRRLTPTRHPAAPAGRPRHGCGPTLTYGPAPWGNRQECGRGTGYRREKADPLRNVCVSDPCGYVPLKSR